MVDTLGWRGKFGVITPSTNTVVQPEYTMQFVRPVSPLILDECIYQMTQYQAMGILMN